MADEQASLPNTNQTNAPDARPHNWQDVGAEFTLPALGLIGAAAGASCLVALIAYSILLSAKPGAVGTIPLAIAPVIGAFTIGTLSMRPWKARRLGRLPMLWMAGRGVCFLAVLVLAALIYSAPRPRPDPLAFGLVLASAYFAALLAESLVMARRLKAPPG